MTSAAYKYSSAIFVQLTHGYRPLYKVRFIGEIGLIPLVETSIRLLGLNPSPIGMHLGIQVCAPNFLIKVYAND